VRQSFELNLLNIFFEQKSFELNLLNDFFRTIFINKRFFEQNLLTKVFLNKMNQQKFFEQKPSNKIRSFLGSVFFFLRHWSISNPTGSYCDVQVVKCFGHSEPEKLNNACQPIPNLDCHIFLDTIFQNGEKYTKLWQHYPKYHKIYQMSLKYTKRL
jgi:hypothetical protein